MQNETIINANACMNQCKYLALRKAKLYKRENVKGEKLWKRDQQEF